MTDLKEFIRSMLEVSETVDTSVNDIITFLNDNKWFGSRPDPSSGTILLSDEQVELYSTPVLRYLSGDLENGVQNSLEYLKQKFPATASLYDRFCQSADADEYMIFYVAGFLATILEKDLFLYTDNEVESLLVCATSDLTKTNGDFLTFFLAWMRHKTKTAYHKDFIMQKRFTMDVQNEAYSFDEYLELVYRLFNADYVAENEMFAKAADSVNYTDTWLYLSMHFICSLRTTDLERIYHPLLPYSPEITIEKVRNGEFTLKDSLVVLGSITDRLCWLPLTPHKTERYSGTDHVKLQFPSECEEHFGRLFALAEAHRQINGTADTPVIRRITSYKDISRYMGEEIGELFLERDFGSRSATKSYLQSVYLAADGDSGRGSGITGSKGYLLASYARSHKGSYGEFASTTFEYLKDARLSGLSPEFVAYELLERGALSFITGELLEMATDGKFAKLSVKEQTEVFKNTGLSVGETEAVVTAVSSARKTAKETVHAIMNSDEDILTVLHNIGCGRAFSKQPGTLCILSAVRQLCPYNKNRNCVGCDYDILTKSTLFHMVAEYQRMKKLHDTTQNKQEKEKYEYIVKNVLLPKLAEALECLRNTYGEDVYLQYTKYIQEVLHG